MNPGTQKGWDLGAPSFPVFGKGGTWNDFTTLNLSVCPLPWLPLFYGQWAIKYCASAIMICAAAGSIFLPD